MVEHFPIAVGDRLLAAAVPPAPEIDAAAEIDLRTDPRHGVGRRGKVVPAGTVLCQHQRNRGAQGVGFQRIAGQCMLGGFQPGQAVQRDGEMQRGLAPVHHLVPEAAGDIEQVAGAEIEFLDERPRVPASQGRQRLFGQLDQLAQWLDAVARFEQAPALRPVDLEDEEVVGVVMLGIGLPVGRREIGIGGDRADERPFQLPRHERHRRQAPVQAVDDDRLALLESAVEFVHRRRLVHLVPPAELEIDAFLAVGEAIFPGTQAAREKQVVYCGEREDLPVEERLAAPDKQRPGAPVAGQEIGGRDIVQQALQRHLLGRRARIAVHPGDPLPDIGLRLLPSPRRGSSGDAMTCIVSSANDGWRASRCADLDAVARGRDAAGRAGKLFSHLPLVSSGECPPVRRGQVPLQTSLRRLPVLPPSEQTFCISG
ncbi:hypothetical protein MGWOODY_Smn2844 [hydrothermal vent metagenome]|uniref:Uncharacterized protein n=1 Tax=hydrothermal vent metagenome TaxID=652676 RepID=A0A160TQ13_9ZZZZ